MMTDADIEVEKIHRRIEGLGISIEGPRAPTPAELNDSFKRANDWEKAYRAAKPEDREP